MQGSCALCSNYFWGEILQDYNNHNIEQTAMIIYFIQMNKQDCDMNITEKYRIHFWLSVW